MKFIKKINEEERWDAAIIGYKIRDYIDAKSLRIQINLGKFFFRFEFGFAKKVEGDLM